MHLVKSLCKLICVVCWVVSVWSAYWITNPAVKNPWLDLYLEQPGLVRQTPSRFVPQNQSSASEDIEFWKSVLPFAQDRNEDLYLVIPGLGLITPIVDIPQWSSDFSKMYNWQEIAINNYLRWWIIEYVWSVDPWYEWKRIDFWHSNYFTNDSWRYKTIFANLMRLDPGDQVWYFQRSSWSQYDLLKYEVTASYPTNPNNVQALKRDGSWADALIFGCYHGLDGRWMIEASYLWTPKQASAQVVDQFPLVDASMKRRIDAAVNEMRYVWIQKRKYQIIRFYKALDAAWMRLSERQEQIKDYTKEQLARIYPR